MRLACKSCRSRFRHKNSRVAVEAWTVVISPSTIPYFSWITLAMGARQLVVQEALETTSADPSYLVWLTPTTNMGASAEGAEMITFLAPPPRCAYGVNRFGTVVLVDRLVHVTVHVKHRLNAKVHVQQVRHHSKQQHTDIVSHQCKQSSSP